MARCPRCGLALPEDPAHPFFTTRLGLLDHRCRLCTALDGLRQAVLQLERRTQLVGQVIFWLAQLTLCVLLVNDYVVEASHARAARRVAATDEDEGSDDSASLP